MESFLNNRSSAYSSKMSSKEASAMPHFESSQNRSEKDSDANRVKVEVESCFADGKAPRVELIMEGERIAKIEVYCTCGESLILACDY